MFPFLSPSSDMPATNKVVFILCANKTDKTSERTVSETDGQTWADQNGCFYFEVSAHSGEGVQKVFQMIFKSIAQVIAILDFKNTMIVFLIT